MKNVINFIEGQEAAPERTYWPIIGSAWKSKKVPGSVSIEIGRKKKDAEGNLHSTFTEVKLVEGARLFLQPNNRKVEGDKQPDFSVALVQDDEKKGEEKKEA